MEAFRRHSNSFHGSFANTGDLSKRAPPQLMAAAHELMMGWNDDQDEPKT
jgi:hypothetical protein